MNERWNKDKKIIDPHELVGEEVKDKVLAIEPSIEWTYKEEEKTEKDKEIISELNVAASEVFLKLGLEKVVVPTENIHILDREEFFRLAKFLGTSDTLEGFYYWDQVFVYRGKPEDQFINDLSHEFAHAVSYYSIRNFVKPRDEQGKILVATRNKRLGYGLNQPESLGFRGFNEGMTEHLARAIRHEVDEKILPAVADRKKFILSGAYWPQIALLDRVFKMIDEQDVTIGYKEFLQGLITGEMSMFKKLEKKKKGIVKVLAGMGGEPADALLAAKQLGFEDVVEEIQGYIDRRK